MSILSSALGPLSPARDLVEKVAFRTVMNLPPRVQRRLAGPPVRLDGQELAVDTQLMLRLSALAGERDPSTVPVAQGRAVLARQAAIGGGSQSIGAVRAVSVADLAARLYVPSDASADPAPLLVFFHGGGFIYGDLDSHDASCRYLAEHSGARVLAVDYRLAPEHPFPAAYDDAVAAFRWTVAHAEELGADPARIGVGGDSAGGNLAAGVALEVGPACAFQLLIYPVTAMDARTESRRLFGEGFYLTTSFIKVASDNYASQANAQDPRLSPLYADVPEGCAPAYVATAGFDPLRDEGEAYARKLEESGVKVELKRYPDQIHGFLNVIDAGRTAKAAVAEFANVLRAWL